MTSNTAAHDRWNLLTMIVPALAISIAFGIALSHRTDYLGHFAAGYGGTLGALALIASAAQQVWRRSALFPYLIVLACIACIALGALFEATVFRLARFDPVDFCNQSLGAVLAALVVLIMSDRRTAAITLGSAIVTAGFFLIAGFFFAFA